MTTKTLENKTIAVMGAAGRIGQHIARATCAAGASVVAVDRDLTALQPLAQTLEAPESMLCMEADITDSGSITAVVNAAVSRYGSLDGLVNAAYPRNERYGRPFLEVRYEDFSENVALHLGGYFLVMQQCVNHALRTQRPFSLVNLSSIYGIMAPRFEVYAGTPMTMPVEYAAIKSGLIHLTRYASAFAKGSRFRANCVSPGGILASQDADFLQRYNSHCRIKGMLDAPDIVGAVVFLLSDASEFVVGQNIVVDDGFSL